MDTEEKTPPEPVPVSRLGGIVSEATAAFWSVVADRVPAAAEGDIKPDLLIAQDTANLAAVRNWIEMNKK